ncbi:MAG TPA: helix-turn-helix domain-containing protein [Caldilineae bacterium]|nr:helix-turn-helix domain-containing protein [Caldilineae bacterium]
MTELLTTKQLQEILQVDRTTIYRMAEAGRIPAIKVGNQWRFPRHQIEAWLWQQQPQAATPVAAPFPLQEDSADLPPNALSRAFPLECVQLIQDTFADLLGVMMVITDLDGNMITQPSNEAGLFTATETSPNAHQRCLEHWISMAGDPRLQPGFQRSHLGLLCARGLIRVGHEIKAMLVVGGIAPEDWPPSDEEIEAIAQFLQIEPDLIRDHVDEVHRADHQRMQEILPYVQRMADVFSYIATDRSKLLQRLDKIAELATW